MIVKVLLIALIVLLIGIFIFDTMPNVNVNDYTSMSSSVLTPSEQELYSNILTAYENGDDVVHYEGEIQQGRIITELGMYYGSMENAINLLDWHEGYVRLKRNRFDAHEQIKTIVDARVDEALFNIKEGSDRFKVWQIAKYISDRVEYDIAHRETIDGLNGRGVCITYTMLFYKMVSRLGIETYICYGYVNDSYHAWNAVVIDDKTRYFDITWFDTNYKNIYQINYADNSNGWNREFVLNDQYAIEPETVPTGTFVWWR